MFLLFAVCAAILVAAIEASCAEDKDQCTGYPVGNFGMGAEITPRGRIFSRVMCNPPVLGYWLMELGRGQFTFYCDGVEIRDNEFESRKVERLYPEASVEYSDPRFGGVAIKASFLSPVKAFNDFDCSLPVVCTDFEFVNSSDSEKEVRAEFCFVADLGQDSVSMLDAAGFQLAGTDKTRFGFDIPTQWRAIEGGIAASSSIKIPAGSSVKVKFLILNYDVKGFYALKCPDAGRMVAYVFENWERFKLDRAELISLLPKTHDDQINRYLRWYIQAAILLTRLTKEHVVTMGYAELNQRDSFWTSWIHLVLWPDLERRMIEESCECQAANGKIPTTILPLIEREDDIDINEYFNLRIARYYEWTHDLDFVRKVWPSFKHSIEYLKSTDKDNDGLLDQGSFWGDWKDVTGVEGRKAGPHFEFLWLATLKHGIELAEKLGDTEAASEYSALYNRSYEVINKPVEQGGMWTGSFYTTLWHDGREDRHVQEDQFVGPLYGVLPEERIKMVYDALQPNMTEWGVRDTYPYRPVFNNDGGDYHNGGVWMFLNFGDAFSRFVTGYPETGYFILKNAAEWDLEKWGDYMPAEYLDGNTGENKGKPIQGWDADYYAAVLFGIHGVKMLSRNKVEILPRIADTETFETPITLPQGILRLKQTPGSDGLEIEIKSELNSEIEVRYGAMTAKSLNGSVDIQIGECKFKAVEFKLAPGQVQKLVYK